MNIRGDKPRNMKRNTLVLHEVVVFIRCGTHQGYFKLHIC